MSIIRSMKRSQRKVSNPRQNRPLQAELLESRLLLADMRIIFGGADVTSLGAINFGTVIEGQAPALESFDVLALRDLSGLQVSYPTGFAAGPDKLSASMGLATLDSFDVLLGQVGPGFKSGTVRVSGNKTVGGVTSAADPVSFMVAGTVLALPEVSVTHDGAAVNSEKFPGSGTAPAGPSLIGFDAALINSVPDSLVFTVSNSGDMPLTMTAGPDGQIIQVPDGYVLVSDLPGSIGAGGSATFEVRLDTAVPGTFAGNISFQNNDAGPVWGDGVDERNFVFEVSGTVTAPDIALYVGDPDDGVALVDGQTEVVDFGEVLRNAAAPTVTFTVMNAGDADLHLGELTLPAGFSTVGDLPDMLEPGMSETIIVAMETATLGAFGGQFVWASDDPDEDPFSFPIVGSVTQPNVAVALAGVDIIDGQATAIDFGVLLQNSAPQSLTFTVTNVGTAALTLEDVLVPAGYTLTEGLVAALAPGASDTFTVQLETDARGVKAGEIVFNNSDSEKNPFNFPVTGTIVAPEIEVYLGSSQDGQMVTSGQSEAFDFGEFLPGHVGESLTFTVRNVGDAALTLGALDIPAGYTVIDGLVDSLAPGSADTFTIQIDTAVSGVWAGEVSFANSDLDENPFTFPITGEVYTVTAGANNRLAYTDAQGVPVTAMLIGPGTLSGYGEQAGGGPRGYVLDGTTGSSLLLITTAPLQTTSVEKIDINGDLRFVYGLTTSIDTALTSTGAVDLMYLHSVGAGAAVQTGAAARGGTMIFSRSAVGDGADFDLAGDLRYLRAASFPSGAVRADNVGTMTIMDGDTNVNVTASEGGVGMFYAVNGDIGGAVLANGDVRSVFAPRGTLSGTVRGDSIGTVMAMNLNQAMLSSPGRIGTVSVRHDVVDSHVLAGYDIGMDGLPGGGDDDISAGGLGSFRFNGAYVNSHVAVGVRPIFSPLIPAPSGGDNSSGLPSTGAAFGRQDNINTDNDGQFFGFYFDSASGATFRTPLQPAGDFRIITAVNE